MVTTEERIQILRMVQEGKISAEEAAQLLEELEGVEKGTVPGSGELCVCANAGACHRSAAPERLAVLLFHWPGRLPPDVLVGYDGPGCGRFGG